jgi:hypothetical protein
MRGPQIFNSLLKEHNYLLKRLLPASQTRSRYSLGAHVFPQGAPRALGIGNAAYFLKKRFPGAFICDKNWLQQLDWPKRENLGSHRETIAAQLSRTWQLCSQCRFR